MDAHLARQRCFIPARYLPTENMYDVGLIRRGFYLIPVPGAGRVTHLHRQSQLAETEGASRHVFRCLGNVGQV